MKIDILGALKRMVTIPARLRATIDKNALLRSMGKGAALGAVGVALAHFDVRAIGAAAATGAGTAFYNYLKDPTTGKQAVGSAPPVSVESAASSAAPDGA